MAVLPGALENLSHGDQLLFIKFGLGDIEHVPFHCVHHAFRSQVLSRPNAIAVEKSGSTITYAELDRQSDCLARTLRHRGVGPNLPVCLLVERSILMVVGVMAILKAGGAYIPLDGSIVTDSTLAHVLKDSEPVLTLTLEKYAHRVAGFPAISLDGRDSICSVPSDHCSKVEDLSSSGDLVYLIYTSGTQPFPRQVNTADVFHRNHGQAQRRPSNALQCH
jgi:non-ribosomal peptide synthetase component F